MKIFCVILITAFVTSLCHKYFHKCNPSADNKMINALMKNNSMQDSLLFLWFNDYAWKIRVMSGIEKDSSVIKYQKWNNKKHGK